MNTLKCKVLFAKLGMLVFLKAIGIYLLITLPALGIPVMYLLSLSYAVSFGWIAAAIFIGVLFALQAAAISIRTKLFLLYLAVVLAVLCAFQMMEVAGTQQRIWDEPFFLLFPLLAIVAGWISLALSSKRLQPFLSMSWQEVHNDLTA